MQRAPSIRLAHVIPRWALVYMLSHSHCLGYTSKLCGCGVPCSPAWRRQWAPLRAARSQPSRRGFPPSSPLATRCVAVPYTLKRSPSRSDGTDPAPHTPAQLFRPAMLVVDWYLLHDRQYGAAGGSFVVTHAAALAALLDAALITNVGGRGALSAVATAHVVLLCASEHNASVLRAVMHHEIQASVLEVGGGLWSLRPGAKFFLGQTFEVNGERQSLYFLEQQDIIGRYQEPLLHITLNCASRGCPPLRYWKDKKMMVQMRDQMRRWIKTDDAMQLDPDGRGYRLNEIFYWYEADFTDWSDAVTVCDWLSTYATGARRDWLEAHAADCPHNPIPYDWSLDAAKTPWEREVGPSDG